MCGRYQLALDATQVAALYAGAVWRDGHAERHSARNQVRPTTEAPVLVRNELGPGAEGRPALMMMKWGMESTAGQSRATSSPTLINARSETVLRLPTFRRALVDARPARRCAVPSTGFYEWYKDVSGSKATPFVVRRKNDGKIEKTMWMAGLYDEEGRFVIITTAAGDEFAWLHNRQPCVLGSREEVEEWVDGGKIRSEEVVPKLEGGRVGWRKMTKDLREESKDQKRPKKQASIAGFFGSRGVKKGAGLGRGVKAAIEKK